MAMAARFDELHDLAAKATGMDDFGTSDYVAPLRHLLDDYDRHNNFPASGEQVIVADLVGQLAGRLFAQSGFKSRPELADAPVEKPLFILGMARTGTTALLRLLSRDPATQSLPLWLAMTPMPRPPRDTWDSHPCYQQVVQGLAQLHEMSPEFKRIHPMAADEPDECRVVLTQSLWSPTMASLASAPSYADWCLTSDARYAYCYYRRVLGLIAAGNNSRWLLKCPTNLWGLDALLDVFPDANIVFTHRDVVTSMNSTASMVYHVRRMRDPDITPEKAGRELLANWGRALDKAEKVRQRHDSSRFFDVHVSQIQSDPLGTVERIYRHFDMPFPEQTRAALAHHSAGDPRMGHGDHQYANTDFGFTAEDVKAAVGEYHERNRAVEALNPSARKN